jgi:S1-C subfamily serine protease
VTDKGEQQWPWWRDDEHGAAEPDTAPLAADGREEPQLGEPSDEADDDFSWAYEGPPADAPRHLRSGQGGTKSQPSSTPPPPGYGPPGYGPPGYGPGSYGPGSYGPGSYGPAGYGPPGYGPPRRRSGRSLAVAAAVGGLLVAAAAGGFVGHVLTASHAPATASSAGNPSVGDGGGSGLGGGFPSSGGSGSTAPAGSGAGPSDAAAIASRVDPGLVDINTIVDYGDAQAAGTGMVLTAGGEVLTNNHVVEGATSISVTDVGNGKTYSATVVGYSVTSDVAVIQLTGASGLQTVTTASAAGSVGEQVVGIGNAGGTGGTPSYAGGTITATDQSITATDDLTGINEQLTGMIETNADIQAGDSGGSLVNDSGQVVGMDTAGSSSGSFQFAGQAQGTGYAIPISTATSIASQIEGGRSSSTVHVGPTAFLGVKTGGDSAGGYGGGYGGGGYGGGGFNTVSGVQISGVVTNSAAADAGLTGGDVITSVGGYSVSSQSALQDVLVDHMSPGQVVTVVYTDTSGQQQSVSLTLGSGPAA